MEQFLYCLSVLEFSNISLIVMELDVTVQLGNLSQQLLNIVSRHSSFFISLLLTIIFLVSYLNTFIQSFSLLKFLPQWHDFLFIGSSDEIELLLVFEFLLYELFLEFPQMRVDSLVLFELLMRQYLRIEWKLTDNDLLELINELDLMFIFLFVHSPLIFQHLFL